MYEEKNFIETLLKAVSTKKISFTLCICFSLYFSHWVGILTSGMLLLLTLYCVVLNRLYIGTARRESLYIMFLMSLYCTLTFLIQMPSLEQVFTWAPIETPRLLFQATSLFLIVAIIGLLRPLPERQLYAFFKYSYILFASTIVVEWVLVNIFGISNSLMPAFRDSHSYYSAFESYYRPFGLTGSAPVNGSLLVFSLWVLMSTGKVKFVHRYMLLTGFILLLNNSGQAFLVYFLTVVYFYSKFSGMWGRYLLAPIFLCGSLYIVFSGIITKVSYEYMIIVLGFLGLESIAIMDHLSQVMGGYGKYSWVYQDRNLTTEFYPIYAISRFGLLLFVVTWLYILFRLPKKNRLIIFLTLFIGSIHYPAVLFVETQVLLAVYILWMPDSKKVILKTSCIQTPKSEEIKRLS